MVGIFFYGVVGEIGGNKILVEHRGIRLMLDFETRMDFASRFFSEFLDVRSNTELRDKLIIGALPLIPGIYRKDMVCPPGMDCLSNGRYGRIISPTSKMLDVPGLVTYQDFFQKYGRSYVDAILLSHAHLDHSGDVGYFHSAVPLYCSKTTRTLVEAIDDVSAFKSQALKAKASSIAFTMKGALPGSLKIEHKEQLVRECKILEDRKATEIGVFQVTMVEVDHSIPGAASYVLECDASGKPFRILYTRDIRFHGTRGTTIDEYVRAIGSEIDLMLCEGTRIDSGQKLSEDTVYSKIAEEIGDTEGLAFVDFSWKDTTRYETISKAAESCGRTFIINARLAYLLTLTPQHFREYINP